MPACEARPWLAGTLRNALDIREFYDVYWSLAAIPYALLIDLAPQDESQRLPPPVLLAAEMRGFVANSLEFVERHMGVPDSSNSIRTHPKDPTVARLSGEAGA